MKRHTFTLLFVCLLGLCGQADAQSSTAAFTMQSLGTKSTIAVDQTFRGDTILAMFGSTGDISGLSVTMDVDRLADDFLVRILLEDAEGHKHLVAESYKEIATADTPQLTFSNYCEETALLDGIIPSKLHVYVSNAVVSLHNLQVSTASTAMKSKSRAARLQQVESLKRQQVQAKVDQINAYNAANNKLWRAGETDVAMMTYDERKRVIGFSDAASSGGIEYYAGGFFEIDSNSESVSSLSIPQPPTYVDEFDWRNRHGKNWMTSVKNQYASNYCVAFSIAGSIEALANIRANQQLNWDLSEQSIASCYLNSTNDPYTYGMFMPNALSYVKNNGVFPESVYPFVNDSCQHCLRDSLPVPDVIYGIQDYEELSASNENLLKHHLINYGPVVLGVHTAYMSHSMVLVGYGKLDENAVINNVAQPTYDFPMPVLGDLVGRPYWIFKNSWGKNYGNAGYMYLLAGSISYFASYYPINASPLINGQEIQDVVCEDSDGDGYYYWGSGPKPANASSWIPDESDGDDSNPLLGPMDLLGFCESLDPEVRDVQEITTSLPTSGSGNLYSHIEIGNGGTWTVNHNQTFYNGAKITVKNGGKLIVNGATLENVEIIMESGALLKVLGGGKIHLRDGVAFAPSVGAIVEIDYGEIQ